MNANHVIKVFRKIISIRVHFVIVLQAYQSHVVEVINRLGLV